MPRTLSRWERDWLVPTFVAVLLVLLAFWLFRQQQRSVAPTPPATPEGYLFCTWNVENLFDDRDDPHVDDRDEDWFGQNPDLVRAKVGRLAEALLLQNQGRGPDILLVLEVESLRALERLRDALNGRLGPDWQYTGLVFHENRTGRHIAPAVLTRLPVRGDRTRTFGIRRILEVHLEADGAPLVVLASHWTSRVTDLTDAKRSAYAQVVYLAFLDHYQADPDADVILAGDFNDEPDDPSLRDHLHITADPAQVRAGDSVPRLLDLMAGRDPNQFGTIRYGGHWQIFDHIVASPGLLDPSGWLVLPDTLRTENPPALRSNTDRRPFRFGGPRAKGPRGYSDHFAVTVRLRVEPQAVR